MAEGNRASRTLGVLRPRTHVFLEFQKAKKLSPTRHHDSGRLLAGAGRSDNSPIDNLSVEDPPQWTDTYAKTTALLKNIEQDLIRLKSTQQQRLQMAFGDVRSKEREVATLSSSVTTAQALVTSIRTDGTAPEQVLENIQHELAARLQALTHRHRTQERAFMEKLGKMALGEDLDPVDTPDFDEGNESLEALDSLSLDRSESVQRLLSNLKELSTLFQDLASLVVKQGTLLDRIDYNVEEAVEHTGQAVGELNKVGTTQANKHQQQMRATTCILVLIVGIVGLALAFILKNF